MSKYEINNGIYKTWIVGRNFAFFLKRKERIEVVNVCSIKDEIRIRDKRNVDKSFFIARVAKGKLRAYNHLNN